MCLEESIVSMVNDYLVLYMFYICFIYVLYMFYICFIYVLYMFYICFICVVLPLLNVFEV